MAYINFDDSLKVGVPFVDQQHQTLIDLMNQLDQAMRDGKGREVVNRTVANLLAYTKQHFAEEEWAMQKAGYVDLVPHKRQHDAFVARIQTFHNELKAGNKFVAVDVMAFLSEWLKRHIQGTDKRYVPSFREKGMTV